MLEERNPLIGEAIDFLDGDSAVAKRAGLKTAWAVSKWRVKLPSDRVLWLAKETGWKFTPHMLAPRLYPNVSDGIPRNKKKDVIDRNHRRRSSDMNGAQSQ